MEEWKIPEHTFSALYRWFRHGYQPGGFLTAVLDNDAWQAAALADPRNREALAYIILFARKAETFHKQWIAEKDPIDSFEIRWESWRIRYSPEAPEIEITEVEDEDDDD